MCCWCFRVLVGVFGNLANRLLVALLDASHHTCRKPPSSQDAAEAFYKDLGRAAAEELLMERQSGTFIIRPSKTSALGTLTVVQDRRVFHLTIRRRPDLLIALGSEKANEKCFRDINSLINYYISNYLVLYSGGQKTLTLLLPYRGN